jgi:hypothetical protein
MLTQTHFTDFNIRAFKGLSIIARHYEKLRTSYDGSRSLYEEVRRYTRTTFAMKQRNFKKDNLAKQIYSFF